MLVKTTGLVLRTIPYSDSSSIATIYTKELGIRTYMLRGVRSTSLKKQGNVYQPLNFLDLVVQERENKSIQYIKEAKAKTIYSSLPYDIRKSAIGLFMLEVINSSIKEEEGNPSLFDFIHNEFIALDSLQTGFSSFHLRFMHELSAYLGFQPFNNYSDANPLFALQDGLFVSSSDHYLHLLSVQESSLFHQFISDVEQKEKALSKEERGLLLEILEKYYQFHVMNFRSFKTPFVFEEVFR